MDKFLLVGMCLRLWACEDMCPSLAFHENAVDIEEYSEGGVPIQSHWKVELGNAPASFQHSV